MPATVTPLRYPGGKTKLYPYIKQIIDLNNLHGTYIEPFAGGAGLALKLLLNNDVNRIVINDSDPAIYAFWHSVLYDTVELCDFVQNVDISVETWNRMRDIYFNQDGHSLVEIGKATLFLNRVNRSGVLKGGLIGGKAQDGEYKMDVRFNRDSLIKKIEMISAEEQRIDVYNLDVYDFLSPTILKHYYKTFINFDPPYVQKGGQLYMDYFSADDHKKLKESISKLNRKWIVTYDICELTEKLYADYRGGIIDITYSSNTARKAQEYIFFSNNIVVPPDTLIIEG